MTASADIARLRSNAGFARGLILAALAVGVIAAVVFLAFPGIDLWATGLFWRAGDGGFWLANAPLIRDRQVIVKTITITVAAVLIGSLLWRWLAPLRYRGPSRLAAVYLLACLIVGPGLVTNTLLKDHWGRARPSHTVEFGGDRDYGPPLLIGDQCLRNCSFVAGDPSVGFYFIAFALAFPRRRWRWLGLGLGLGAAIGLVRILQGGHFLSDVVFSGVVNAMVFVLLYWVLLALWPAGRGGRRTG